MPDIEAVLNPWAEAATGARAGAATPADLEKKLPFIRVERISGPDGPFTTHPTVAVDVFASTADQARALSNTLSAALIALRGPVNGAVIRSVRCTAGPSRQPWANEAIHRRGATYSVSYRAA
ncbi:hypothetical protein J7I94_19070 [Streptomyces sp. ISL-12]|uniref:hypothetical protein n=1 Tax=Streptomyces sp. ISL-12 TaxID=2819177 RepID=UPI001BE53824|nr:hypothetical protein [Streptomyces sp. ISL-12]MBT2412636.1 hypothetical protein [Streptomyces sp. ISL-12]